jgi:hypothetical protein
VAEGKVEGKKEVALNLLKTAKTISSLMYRIGTSSEK